MTEGSLSNEDRDILRWSGELDGAPGDGDLAADFDTFAAAVAEMPAVPAPSSALAAAVRRDAEERGRARHRVVRLRWVLASAAAVMVLGPSVFALLKMAGNPGPAVVETPGSRDASPSPLAPLATPVSPNFERIRGVRSRIARTRDLDKPLFSRKTRQASGDTTSERKTRATRTAEFVIRTAPEIHPSGLTSDTQLQTT